MECFLSLKYYVLRYMYFHNLRMSMEHIDKFTTEMAKQILQIKDFDYDKDTHFIIFLFLTNIHKKSSWSVKNNYSGKNLNEIYQLYKTKVDIFCFSVDIENIICHIMNNNYSPIFKNHLYYGYHTSKIIGTIIIPYVRKTTLAILCDDKQTETDIYKYFHHSVICDLNILAIVFSLL